MTAIHTHRIQSSYSSRVASHGIYAFLPQLTSWMPAMGANILLFLPRRPPANNASMAYFVQMLQISSKIVIYLEIYSTLKTLGPFLLVDLFFLWPLSNDTALW